MKRFHQAVLCWLDCLLQQYQPVSLNPFCHSFRQFGDELIQHHKVHHLFGNKLLCQYLLPTGISELQGKDKWVAKLTKSVWAEMLMFQAAGDPLQNDSFHVWELQQFHNWYTDNPPCFWPALHCDDMFNALHEHFWMISGLYLQKHNVGHGGFSHHDCCWSNRGIEQAPKHLLTFCCHTWRRALKCCCGSVSSSRWAWCLLGWRSTVVLMRLVSGEVVHDGILNPGFWHHCDGEWEEMRTWAAVFRNFSIHPTL